MFLSGKEAFPLGKMIALWPDQATVGLKVRRFALEIFPAAKLADEFSIARRDLAAHGDDMRASLNFESFERVVIEQKNSTA